ncbi:hypothetical protein ABD91_20140 [Lysinibacillus sphaericus]|uniref:type II secretion system F family protein n=1 Tax=Lysinibacillus sphaericus TaxID=1421 RepID=UPI0018CC8345|nr:hypothetical protein [Lysinibacillus sphaericus]MBG9693070.1 hypothetical protein [Lysinibacillus sphaericus]
MYLHWLLLGIAALFTIITMFLMIPKKDQVGFRKDQSKNHFRENVLMKQINQVVEKRTKFSKRYKLESAALQAGISLKYSEIMIISVVTGFAFATIFGFLMNNFGIFLIFLVLGFLFPKQILEFLRNRRVDKMEAQVGPFMHMVLKRYDSTGDFGRAIQMSAEEFVGEEPIYSELQKTIRDINLGINVSEAMNDLARRCGNVYMQRLADYYAIASEIGTEDMQRNLLPQAYIQYEDHQQIKRDMKKELSTVKRDSYLMLGMVPVFILFSISVHENYIQFMTETLLGQIATVCVTIVFLVCLWVITKKISAPLEEVKDERI